jgi:acyl carrier protein
VWLRNSANAIGLPLSGGVTQAAPSLCNPEAAVYIAAFEARVRDGIMADLASDVIAVIAGKVRGGRPQIQLTDKLEDLGLESLDAVEMIFELEEKFDITIPYNANDARTEFDTVGDVVRAVTSLVNGKA